MPEESNGGAETFLVGAGLTALVAVAHNNAKNRTHQQEVAELVEQRDQQTERADLNYEAWEREYLAGQDKDLTLAELTRRNAQLEDQLRQVRQELASCRDHLSQTSVPDENNSS